MNNLRRLAITTRSFLYSLIVIVSILAAIVVGIGKLLLPYIDYFHPEIEQLLSGYIGKDVTFKTIEGDWQVYGPKLHITDFALNDGENDTVLSSAEIDFNWYRWLFTNEQFLSFAVNDISFEITRDKNGQFSILGIDPFFNSTNTNQNKSILDIDSSFELIKNTGINIKNGYLTYNDELLGINLNFGQLNAIINAYGDLIIDAQMIKNGDSKDAKITLMVITHDALKESLNGLGKYVEKAYFSMENSSLEVVGELLSQYNFESEDGSVALELWVDFANSDITVDGNVKVNNIVANSGESIEESLVVNHINSNIHLTKTEKSWQLFADNLTIKINDKQWPVNHLIAIFKDNYIDGYVNYLNINDLSNLFKTAYKQTDKENAFSHINATGDISDFHFSFNASSSDHLHLKGKLSNGTIISDNNNYPSVIGLNGDFAVDESKSFNILLDSHLININFPKLFENQLTIKDVKSSVQGTISDNSWNLSLADTIFSADNAMVKLSLDLLKENTQKRPFINGAANVKNLDIKDFSKYLPVGVMPEKLVHWLKENPKAGLMENGNVIIYGDLTHWPFRNNLGTFNAQARLKNTELRYHEDWPLIKKLNGKLDFTGYSMEINSNHFMVEQLEAINGHALISDYRNPELIIDADGKGEESSLLDFLKHTPLYDGYKEYLDQIALQGDQQITTNIHVPLVSRLGKMKIDGAVTMIDNQFDLKNQSFSLDEINGKLTFSRNDFSGKKIQADFKNESVLVDVSAINSEDKMDDFSVAMQGMLPVKKLASYLDMPSITSYASGKTLWQGHLHKSASSNWQITLTSDLEGVAINMPLPMRKDRAVKKNITIEWVNPWDKVSAVNINYDEAVQLSFEASETNYNKPLIIHLAQQLPDEMATMASSASAISGVTDELNVDQWLGLFDQLVAEKKNSFAALSTINLDVKNLIYMDRIFNNVSLQANDCYDYCELEIVGDDIKGKIRFPQNDSIANIVTAEFEQLKWPKSLEENTTYLNKNDKLPTLHLFANEFTYGDYELGQLRLETYPQNNNYKIANLEINNDIGKIKAIGDWDRSHSNYSNFMIKFAADDINSLLTQLGFSSVIEDSQVVAAMDLNWQGSPWDFTFDQLSGSLDLNMGAGYFVEADPGVGRVLGLLSIQALPRRLSLDFTDFFNEGLSFDSIAGSFVINNGVATINDLLITAPSADFVVIGTTDLVLQKYNQKILVLPNMSSTLPIVGALTGGPAAAAALFVLQNAFKKPLGSMASAYYEINGPWQDPEIKLIKNNAENKRKFAVKSNKN